MTEEKQPTILQVALAKIIEKINVTNILMTAITVMGAYFGVNVKETVDATSEKQAQATTWQAKRDSINKINVAKMDTILFNQKKIMDKLKIKP